MKPRRIVANPVQLAMLGAAKLPQADRDTLRAIGEQALTGLRTGNGDLVGHWKSIADALNVAEQLSVLGICSDQASRDRIEAGHEALASVHARHHERNSWTLTAAELRSLDDGLWIHRVQLEHCSLSEYERAVTRVRHRTSQALAGNAAPGVQVLGGLR